MRIVKNPGRGYFDFGFLCQNSKMVWLAFEKFATTGFSDELAVPSRNLSAHRYHMRPPLDRHAFEGVIIHIHSLILSRDRAAKVRIINYQVRIRPDLNGAFSREKAENFGGLGAGGIDEPVQVQSA